MRQTAFVRLRKAAPDDYTARFLEGALVEIITRWVETDFAADPHVLANTYTELAAKVLA